MADDHTFGKMNVVGRLEWLDTLVLHQGRDMGPRFVPSPAFTHNYIIVVRQK